MADLSFTFDPSDLLSKVTAAQSKASDASSKAVDASGAVADGSNALSKITDRSAIWDKASAASSAVIVVASTASDAVSAASQADSVAHVASAKAVSMASTIIRSIPTSGSRAVHEILYTAGSSIKYVYSSNAEA